jgi:serine phosphatase RsbU (regulator of sigma subunit)/integral membrane sensor domain MASE1/anti-sigma regulatory factor (Ser/Thr protein kinase)
VRRHLAYAALLGLVAAAYVAFAEIGFSLAFSVRQVTAVWPPAGIAVAAFVLYGSRVWPGVLLGAFLANAMTGEPIYTAIGIAAGNTLGPAFGASLLRRFSFKPTFERVRDVLVFAICGSMLAMVVTATNGTLQLGLARLVHFSNWKTVWGLWWVGDAMGVLLFAPAILTWTSFRPSRFEWWRALELVALLAGAATAAWAQFVSPAPFLIQLYPFIIWAALRFGGRVVSGAILLISTIAIWGTIHGTGPFLAGTNDQRLSSLVVFGAVLSLTGLVLHAVMTERQSALSQMRAATLRFRTLAETVPQIVWTADPSGRIDWSNRRSKEFPPGMELVAGIDDWDGLIASRHAFEREVLLARDDGLLRWFLVRGEPMLDEQGRIVRWYGTHTDIDEQKRALERSARIATTLQAAFLPQVLPEGDNLTFDALYLPASRDVFVGGDWYDAFTIRDGRVLVSVGDVTGHGLEAAVSAGRVRQSVVAVAADLDDPATILGKVNHMLHLHQTCVATALIAIIDAKRMSMRFASAGHPPPVVASPGHPARELQYGELPLGVEKAAQYTTYDVQLDPESIVAFYTDGFIEFSHDITAAEQRLREAVDACVAQSVPNAADTIRHMLLGASAPIDDAVLLVARLSRSGAFAAEKPVKRMWSFHSGHAYGAHSARHEVMAYIRRVAGESDDVMRTELILGEILANTVEHAPGMVNVEIDWTGQFPLLTVVDAGPGLKRFAAQLPASELDEHGRGLYLVKSLARELRVESDPGYGTKISVVLPLTRVAQAV